LEKRVLIGRVGLNFLGWLEPFSIFQNWNPTGI